MALFRASFFSCARLQCEQLKHGLSMHLVDVELGNLAFSLPSSTQPMVKGQTGPTTLPSCSYHSAEVRGLGTRLPYTSSPVVVEALADTIGCNSTLATTRRNEHQSHIVRSTRHDHGRGETETVHPWHIYA